ncbi:MAG: nucleotide exchange factor GrpE [Terriglobia bacterium]
MEPDKNDNSLNDAYVAAGENSAPGEAREASGADAPKLPEDLPAAYQKALAEKQEWYDLALRKQAELENFRKRTQREKDEIVQHANAELMRSLLPALDGFDRALKHRDANAPAEFYEGLELIYRQLMDTLGRAGLKAVEAKGEIFDPHAHQAVETVESDEHRDQEVIEELQRGYTLRHRLLRPAIVKVAVPPKDRRG